MIAGWENQRADRRINVFLPPALLEALDAQAKAARRDRSEFVRLMIEQKVSARTRRSSP